MPLASQLRAVTYGRIVRAARLTASLTLGALLTLGCGGSQPESSPEASESALSGSEESCRDMARRLCSNVNSRGELRQCLMAHADQFPPECRRRRR